MTKKYASAFFIFLLGIVPAAMLGQDARTVLTNASKAMGADNLKTLSFSAMGSQGNIGQSMNPKTAGPVARVKSYTYEADYAATSSHVQFVRVQNGADQTVNQYVSANSPWDSQFDFWLSPFAFIKAAMANNPTVRSETIDGMRYNVVTVSIQNKYKLVGYIDERNLVEKVQTWIDNDVLGDMLAEAWYNAYKDFGGVKFPTTIVEKQAGFPVLILIVSDVKPNSSVTIPTQLSSSNPSSAQTVSVDVERIADGVFYLKGGTHHSVAVEFADHVAIVEAPLNEQRSLAVIAEVKKLIPNKPIRYVINTHHHFDHSGGLRTYVDEGSTIVTHEVNKTFFEQAFSAPRTLNPDRLARSQKKPMIESIVDKKVLGDGTRPLEIYLIKDNEHSDGILMAFLPKEKILIEADVFTPPNPVTVNRNTVNLVENVERLKLDFEKILPLHGPGAVSRTDLYAAVRKPAPAMADILAQTPSVPANGQRGQRGQTEDRGKQILESVCTTCHNLNRVQTKNLAQSDWQTIIDRMKGKGAELSDDDTSALVDHLVKSYGPKQ